MTEWLTVVDKLLVCCISALQGSVHAEAHQLQDSSPSVPDFLNARGDDDRLTLERYAESHYDWMAACQR